MKKSLLLKLCTLFIGSVLGAQVQAYAQTCTNLVVNGNFSAGNTGFASDYTYKQTSVVEPGTYAIGFVPYDTVFFAGNDHTNPPTGLAMAINGHPPTGVKVWEQTITGLPMNTVYYFSTWVKKLGGGGQPILQFSVNDAQIGTNFSPSTNGSWLQFSAIWNSGLKTSATIRIINQSTSSLSANGGDLDEIAFTSKASLQIAVRGNGVTIVNGDVTPSAFDHTDFGNVAIGNTFARTYTVLNTGCKSFTVSGITFNGAHSAQFISGALPNNSPIPPNGSATFTVNFSPTSAGLKKATVGIIINTSFTGLVVGGSDQINNFQFAVQGTGTYAPPNARLAAAPMTGDEVKVYPNPNTGSFVVELPYIEDQARITVTDVQGKVIGRRTVVTDKDGNKIRIELGDIAHGVYFVEAVYGDNRFRTKVVVH